MTPEVKDALFEWCAGVTVGLTPLVAHFIAVRGIAHPGQVEGSWSVDWLFLAIATSATSIVSVVTKFRRATPSLMSGRAAPALTALTILFLVGAAVLYAIVATGLALASSTYLAFSLFIGAAAISLYFEFTLAARVAQTGHIRNADVQS